MRGAVEHVFDLEQPRTERMPIHPAHRQAGYSYLLHRHHEDEFDPEKSGPRTGAAGVIICSEHTGTHIDALSHQSDALILCGGVPVSEVQSPRGFKRHGVEEIPPIVAPGVLLDVAAKDGVESLEPGRIVTAADLVECCEAQGVGVEAGSVALVRLGNAGFWDDEERYLAGPGMDASAARWMADKRRAGGRGRQHGVGRAGGERSRAGVPYARTPDPAGEARHLHYREPGPRRARSPPADTPSNSSARL